MKNLVLAVDCGTQSLKALVFSSDGTIREQEKIEYAPYESSRPGWAEQDPDIFWQALVSSCGRIKERSPEIFSGISGLGVTALRDTMINLGSRGEVLRPAITWLDTRKAGGSFKPRFPLNLLYWIIRKDKVVLKAMRDGKGNWLQENEKTVWENTWKYLQVSGFLNYRLTGIPADSVASMVGHIPMDYRKRDWGGRFSLKRKLFPVESEKLCILKEPGEIIGGLTAEAAEQTGLPRGLPVIACGSDKSCETLGAGCLDTSRASLSFGTMATVGVVSRRYFEPLPFLPSYCSAYPGAWTPEIEIYRGYWMISWFRDQMGQMEQEEAERRGVLTEELLEKLLHADPPGCRGLMMQPYWGPGLKDPLAKGALIGFGDVHTRSSIYRATIEGLGYELREGLETLERRGRFRCPEVAASGGASRSDLICQITSDILNRPLYRPHTYETSALGAAVLVHVGLGNHPDVDRAVQAMTSREKTFYPQKENARLYQKLFRVYKKIYPRMQKLYREIQDITGYPEI